MKLTVVLFGFLFFSGFRILGADQIEPFSSDQIKPFSSDGCSASPDDILGRSIVHCCIEHDFDYFVGGPEELKTQADQKLEECIQATLPKGGKIVGEVYKYFVNQGGKPSYLQLKSPFTWRWAYGWKNNREYSGLNLEERKLALKQLEILKNALPIYELSSETPKNYLWRFQCLLINKKQYLFINKALDKKINELKTHLND